MKIASAQARVAELVAGHGRYTRDSLPDEPQFTQGHCPKCGELYPCSVRELADLFYAQNERAQRMLDDIAGTATAAKNELSRWTI